MLFSTKELPTGKGSESCTDTLHIAFTPLPSFAVQVILEVPLFTPVTNPVALTDAIDGLLLLQVTSLFEAFVGMIAALNCFFAPYLSVRFSVLNIIFVTFIELTVTLQDP